MFPRLRNDAPARCIDVIRLIDVRDEERGLLFLREAISISHGENKGVIILVMSHVFHQMIIACNNIEENGSMRIHCKSIKVLGDLISFFFDIYRMKRDMI